MRGILKTIGAAALLASALPVAGQVPPAATGEAASGVAAIEGDLADGTGWLVQMPRNWNGTLILDLDAAAGRQKSGQAPTRPPMPFTTWLLSQGYAYGGITREPIGYDFPKAVAYLLDVRGRSTAKWGAPRRTLVMGGSRGGFVVRKALELHPEIFDGGLSGAGGGAGEIAVLNNKLNALFVLKTLVDPASPMPLVNIGDARQAAAALGALVAKANATPQGRARLALAGAVEQFAPWSSRDKPKPAADAYDAIVDQMAENFVFATAVPVRAGVEKVAGGNVSWNTDADYARLLARSGRQRMVDALYAKAGLRLADDLAVLARTPRIAADPQAVRRAEPLMTYTGKIKDPLVVVDNDDPVDPASDKIAYLRTLERAGTQDMLRLIWSDLPGHGGQTPLDRAVGFTMLIERLDRGRWGDFSLPALKARATRIKASSAVPLGDSAIFDPGTLPPPANEWDVAQWGRYRP